MNHVIDLDEVNRLRELLKTPEQTLEHILFHVASGGSMIDLCEDWGVSYARLSRWLHDDPERTRLLNEAFEDRKEHAKETILTELRRLATFDPRKLFDKHGQVLQPDQWSRDIAAMVSNFEVHVDKEGNSVIKVKLWNKEKGLELLGKNISMFIDRVDHSGKLSLEELITLSRDEDE